MKKIERRAFVCRILAGVLALGLCLFVGKWFLQGGKWVSAAFNRHLYNNAGQLSCRLGNKLHLANRRNTGKSLSTESQGSDAEKILRLRDLAGGVAHKGFFHLAWRDAFPVVGDPHQRGAAVLDLHSHSAFSTSSFTMEEGRSMTSPAAILSMVFLSSTEIVFMNYPTCS